MAITLPAPAASRTGGDILNFMMSLSANADRQKTLDLQKQQLDVSKEALGIEESKLMVEEKKLPSTLEETEARTMGYRIEAIRNLSLAKESEVLTAAKQYEFNYLKSSEDLRRQADVAKLLGGKSEADQLRSKADMMKQEVDVRNKLAVDNPDEYKKVVLSEAYARMNKAEVDAARQQVATAGTMLQALKFAGDRSQQLSEQAMDIMKDIDDPMLRGQAVAAFKANDMDAFGKIAAVAQQQSLEKTGEEFKQKKEIAGTAPMAQTVLDRKNYGPLTLTTLKNAQDRGLSGSELPETRPVPRPESMSTGWFKFGEPGYATSAKDNPYVLLTEEEAKLLGPDVWEQWKGEVVSAKSAANKAVKGVTPKGNSKTSAAPTAADTNIPRYQNPITKEIVELRDGKWVPVE